MSGTVTDPEDPRLTRGVDSSPVKQAEVYLVLSDEERAKGFVRPYRDTYRHVGENLCGLVHPTLKLGEEAALCTMEKGHEGECTIHGPASTVVKRMNGCGHTTKMGHAIAETYACDPHFYGSTYCVHCQMHRPVREFVWEGTQERVGS